MSKFQNLNNSHKISSFDSFNGTETKVYLKIPTLIDEYERVKDFKLVELGHTMAIQARKQHVAIPQFSIGSATATSLPTGDMIVTGSIIFQVMAESMISEVMTILKESNIYRQYIGIDENGNTFYKEQGSIKNFNELPLVSIVIISVKENDAKKAISKEISGVRFTDMASGVGIQSLGVSERYNFTAKNMTDFRPVSGVEIEKDGEDTSLEFDGIFGW